MEKAIKPSRVAGLGSPAITSSFSNFNFRRSYLECCINSISYLSGSSVKIKRVPFEVSIGPSVMGVLECSSLKMQLSKFSTSKARCTRSSGTSIFPESGNEHNSSSQSVPGKRRKTSVEPRGEVFFPRLPCPEYLCKTGGTAPCQTHESEYEDIFLSRLIIKLNNCLVVIHLFFYDADQLNKTSLGFCLKP